MPATAIKPRDPAKFDSKTEILSKLGDLSGYELIDNTLLLAIYSRPEMSPGGIIMTANTLKEDVYQGKAALVVKIGPNCQFSSLVIGLHDWVVVRPSDTWSLDINGDPETLEREDFWPCRLVFADQIRGRISQPGMVW